MYGWGVLPRASLGPGSFIHSFACQIRREKPVCVPLCLDPRHSSDTPAPRELGFQTVNKHTDK